MNKIFFTFFLSILILPYASATFAVEGNKLIPPTDFQAFDTPDDNGKSISLRWPSSPTESAEVEYVVYASLRKDGPFITEALRINSNTMYEEGSDSNFHYVEIKPEKFFNKKSDDTGGRSSYFFKLVMMSNPENVAVKKIASAVPEGNWFNWKKLNNFIILIAFSALVLLFIEHAKKNPDLYLRKISGLDAIDDALGRATEMGKPVLFVHG
ncbi:MAG: DUF6754 domain-containing protein, partial [Planctomycetota bacterium]